MNRDQLSFIFLLIFSALILTVSSVFSSSSGEIDHLVYLPLIQRIFTWQEVGVGSASGGGISNTGHSSAPSLAIAPDGKPYVAFEDYSTDNSEIYVRRWNGSSWEEVGTGSASGGGISNNSTYSSLTSIAIAPDGTPYVVWQDSDSILGLTYIYVRRWNGSIWEEVGAGSASGTGISGNTSSYGQPVIAIAPNGTPYVAWSHLGNGNVDEIYIKSWDGNNWVEIGGGSASGGGISNNFGISNGPSLAIAPDGTPYVAWRDSAFGHNGADEIYIRRWNGSIWEEVGAGSASAGGISNNLGFSYYASLAIAPDGTPYVAWNDTNNGGQTEIYVRAWNGSSWAEAGTGSASGGGISNNTGGSWLPSISVAPNGTPYVAWSDYSDGGLEVYVKRWTGNSWVEVGENSASLGGISNNLGDSDSPSLAIAADDTPFIAWQDNSGKENYEIYILHFTQ